MQQEDPRLLRIASTQTSEALGQMNNHLTALRQIQNHVLLAFFIFLELCTYPIHAHPSLPVATRCTELYLKASYTESLQLFPILLNEHVRHL